jgi:threonylcarbamoyladenosine tRNA methylthiotransferase MtaB
MARNTNPYRYRSLIDSIRQRYPQMGITTDIMVGFPGETEFEFEQSQSFVREIEFAGGHVFTYSERPGTSAQSFPNAIPNSIRRKRSRRMRSILETSSQKYQSGFLGREVSVLWEGHSIKGAHGWSLDGRSSENLRIRSYGESDWHNQIQQVRITKLSDETSLEGTIVFNPDEA